MQVYLLNRRFQQQQQIIWQGAGGVQDRTIYEDSVFARMLRNAGLMEERDYQVTLNSFTDALYKQFICVPTTDLRELVQ